MTYYQVGVSISHVDGSHEEIKGYKYSPINQQVYYGKVGLLTQIRVIGIGSGKLDSGLEV